MSKISSDGKQIDKVIRIIMDDLCILSLSDIDANVNCGEQMIDYDCLNGQCNHWLVYRDRRSSPHVDGGNIMMSECT